MVEKRELREWLSLSLLSSSSSKGKHIAKVEENLRLEQEMALEIKELEKEALEAFVLECDIYDCMDLHCDDDDDDDFDEEAFFQAKEKAKQVKRDLADKGHQWYTSIRTHNKKQVLLDFKVHSIIHNIFSIA